MRTFSVVECSTAHVPEKVADALEELVKAGPYPVLSWEFGFWLYVPGRGALKEYPSDLDEHLQPLFDRATEQGAEWLRLDRDAQQVDGLPVYEW